MAGKRSAPSPPPPLSAPLRAVQAELARRADAGDGAAGCRLAAEWQYCHAVRYNVQATERMLDVGAMEAQLKYFPEGEQRDRARASALKSLERTKQSVHALMDEYAHCDGAELGDPMQAAARWRQAALNGNEAALRQYATGNAFRRNQTLNVLPALETYVREAELLAWRAADAGDPHVAMALANAYDPGNEDVGFRVYLRQTVRPDPVAALALYLRVQDSMSNGESETPWGQALARSVVRLSTGLSPAQRGIARNRARQGRPLPPGSITIANAALTAGVVQDIGREQCEGLDKVIVTPPSS